VALLHTLGTGSDVRSAWLQVLAAVCVVLVLAAVLVRALAGWTHEQARERGLALGGALAFALGLVLWLPSGPLGSEWARRSGTPSALLGHSAPRSRIVVSP
jgi:hypothetical protein